MSGSAFSIAPKLPFRRFLEELSMLRSYGLTALRGAAVAATATLLIGPALADNAPARPRSSCAFVRQIDNFKEVDDYTAIIETSPSRRYKVTFVNRCRELKWAHFARVDARPGICLSAGDKIIVGRHGFYDRCVIRSVEALPPRNRTAPTAY
jgi:hypothetical protein